MNLTWSNVTVTLRQLHPWQGNPKTTTAKQAGQLVTSHDDLGQFQTVAISPFDAAGLALVYDGHQRLSAWLQAYGPDFAIQALQASRPLTEQEQRKIAIYSRQIGAWDWDILSGWQPQELTAWGFDVDLLTDWRRDVAALGNFLESEQAEGDDQEQEIDFDWLNELPLPGGVPDTIWPTDNEYGIPMLDIARQADAFDLPIETWGAKKRGTRAGTLHFYTEDYRYSALWSQPGKPLETGAVNMVEPNYSVYDQVPRVVALWATYRKRWLARYWQSTGVRIFVDLNVARPYDDINLLGVPRGWRAYATRGYSDRLQALDEELAIAKAHAADSVLFLVYGGGKQVKTWCEAHAIDGAVWAAEDMDRAKGKYLDASGSEVQDGKE